MGFWEPLHRENTNVHICLLDYPNSYIEMLKLFLKKSYNLSLEKLSEFYTYTEGKFRLK
jgi:hypothetical protein